MARDTATVTQLTVNTDIAFPTGTAVNVSNGGQVAVTKGMKTVLWFKNTNGSDRVVTIKAGDSSISNGVGDLEITVPATSGHKIVSVETSRFLQDDGYIHLDFAASFAGTFGAIELP